MSSISEVRKTPESIYAIDIDETILYYENLPETWWLELAKKIASYPADASADASADNDRILSIWENIIKKSVPVAINPKEFMELVEYCKNHNSHLILLTARYTRLDSITREHLKIIFPDYQPEIIFCSNENKGLKLRQAIDVNKYKHLYFIDDKQYNIDNVVAEYPLAKTHLFQRA
jgi:hypothetical protein